MKLSSKQLCQIQDALINLTCPGCGSHKVKLVEKDGQNVVCEDCGCEFEFAPDIVDNPELMP